MRFDTRQINGFTMLEVVLSVAILGILFSVGTPVYQSFQMRNELANAAFTVTQTLWRAQSLSRAVASDSDWGVYVQSGSITLFLGSSYATRDSSYDEIYDVPISIIPSGISQIIFTSFDGLPQTTGSVILSYSPNESRTITINEKGTVDY